MRIFSLPEEETAPGSQVWHFWLQTWVRWNSSGWQDETFYIDVNLDPPGRTPPEAIVKLIVYYLVLVIVGDLAAYLIGLGTEHAFGGYVSLLVFLALYFLVLWISWILAVRLTAPKPAAPATTISQ